MSLKLPQAPGAGLFKQGYSSYSNADGQINKSIAAIREIHQMCLTSMGPCGRNKIIVNHLGRTIVTNDAATMLRDAMTQADAGGDLAVLIEIDRHYRAKLHLARHDPAAITSDVDGLRLQFDAASARRGKGLHIDWADDARGKGLIIDNPNAPKPVRDLSPLEAAERTVAGTLTIVDVRPPGERALASIAQPFLTLDDGGQQVRALPPETAMAFLCHHGGRSLQAAEQFRQLGFREVYNIGGGIDAWSQDADPGVPRYSA